MAKYTQTFREEMLAQLAENFGDVPMTARQNNIPTRTLYRWKNALLAQKTGTWHKKFMLSRRDRAKKLAGLAPPFLPTFPSAPHPTTTRASNADLWIFLPMSSANEKRVIMARGYQNRRSVQRSSPERHLPIAPATTRCHRHSPDPPESRRTR